jgi:hypothetical protein
MDDHDLVPVQDQQGRTVWVTRPPEHCANGHPFRPGDITTYGEGGFACWCDGARSDDDGRAFHNTYTCQTCGAVTLVPPCTDPGAAVGWGASHAH